MNAQILKQKQRKIVRSGMGVQGRYKIQVLNADGSIAIDRPWKKNLILDQGLNQWCGGTGNIAQLSSYCVVGTGTTPTTYDSGVITVTISGGTATASAPFFASLMTGMLLVADTGEQQYMTYVSSTVATVTGSNSVVAQLFTVYAVNQTGLASESKRTNTYLTGVGNCGTSTVTATRTNKRTYDFSPEVSPQNYEELGWSNTNSSGNNLFSRTLIDGGTVTVLASQQLRVIYEVTILVTPNTAQPQALSISGWPVAPATTTDGDYIANANDLSNNNGQWVADVGTNGDSGNTGKLEPLDNGINSALCAGSTLPAFNANYTKGTNNDASSGTLQSYVSGNFYRDIIFLWQANNTDRTDIRGISFGEGSNTGAVFVFDEAQTKDDEHLLEITFRRSVGRVITNP